jgi:putative acetyltransferase
MGIREERPSDVPHIRAVNTAAFGRSEEADLVDRLRADGEFVLSLVAEDAAGIQGHILFTRLSVVSAGTAIPAVALAPVAVLPERQKRGIGSALIREGLSRCQARGHSLCVVLGHADYYPRFGFSAELARRLEAPFSGPSFMALELKPGALAGVATVTYPAAFGIAAEG